MAEQRQLPATPRRRQKAREKGQVARSPELGPALGLLVATWALGLVGRLDGTRFADWAVRLWSHPQMAGNLAGASVLLQQALEIGAIAVAPVAMAAMVVGVVATGAQTGFLFSLVPLQPRLDALNPLKGVERMFSARAVADLLKALLKFLAVAVAIYGPAMSLVNGLPSMAGRVDATAVAVWQACVTILTRVAIATLAIAAADIFYQRWEMDRSLRMTREEFKEEMRETEGDPQVRALRRRRQHELARRRMMADVRRADVVVTNPTHYAVALSYRPEQMRAPVVVAKGRGFLARRIREVAAAAGVLITENPPLARELYRTVKIGRPIPPALYQAVAEVLAFVWRVKKRGV